MPNRLHGPEDSMRARVINIKAMSTVSSDRLITLSLGKERSISLADVIRQRGIEHMFDNVYQSCPTTTGFVQTTKANQHFHSRMPELTCWCEWQNLTSHDLQIQSPSFQCACPSCDPNTLVIEALAFQACEQLGSPCAEITRHGENSCRIIRLNQACILILH